jgi:hypothetical protein
VPAPVVGDHPVAVVQQEEHLGVPSDDSGHPWLKTIGCPVPQSL